MRTASMSSVLVALVVGAGLVGACGDPGASEGETTAESETGEAETETETETGTETETEGDGDGDQMCTPAPDECLRLIRCVEALVPDQLEEAEATYGENGTCWCGTQFEYDECLAECEQQLDAAIANYPTVNECHQHYCALDELDPAEPYGPVIDGACPDWSAVPQAPLLNPLEAPGEVCGLECSGIAKYCPGHTQTSAVGSCIVTKDETSYCAMRCYVIPTAVGGTQCQCGAKCHPTGSSDGEGQMRGICTFEN